MPAVDVEVFCLFLDLCNGFITAIKYSVWVGFVCCPNTLHFNVTV